MRNIENSCTRQRVSVATFRRGSAFFAFLLLLLAAVMPALSVSCSSPGNDCSRYVTLPEEGWRYCEPALFAPEHPDSVARGTLAVAVRHDNSYPYRALWLELTYKDGDLMRRDTVCLHLADGYGRWLGRGIGTSFQLSDTVNHPFVHVSGDTISLRHIMRTDTLRGLNSIGIFFMDGEAR